MIGINLGRDTTMLRQVTYVIFWNEIKSEIFLRNIYTCLDLSPWQISQFPPDLKGGKLWE